MPPRKKRRQAARKAQLLFHQPPLEGPKHRGGLPVRLVTHTTRVPSKPIDHATITSWVSPQFETTAESWFPANRKRKRHHQDQTRHSSRKSTTSKFPHLIFESPHSPSSAATLGVPLARECPNQADKDVSRRPLVPLFSPQSCGELSARALQDLPYVFIAPDIQTPEPSPVPGGPVPPDQSENSLLSCSLHTSPPESPEPGPVLVKDTPEEKYGVKVTWRRRQHLFAYLRDRGKLSKSQFLVQN